MGLVPLYNLFTVNKNGFTPFAIGRCQSLLQTTSMGSHPLLLEDVKVYYSQRVWVHTLCYWKMSRSTTVNEYGFTPYAIGRCQGLLQSMSMGILCYWKMSRSTTVNKYGFTPFANGRRQSLLQTTSTGSHPLLMVDVKVYYSQQVWAHTLC